MSSGVKSGLLGRHKIESSLPIHFLGNDQIHGKIPQQLNWGMEDNNITTCWQPVKLIGGM
jgi:hypothetical protein